MRQMPGAAESEKRAAHDGKEDPSCIVGRLKEQAAFCGVSWPNPGKPQNGFTMTRMTMTTISNVGISLTIRQCLAGFSFLSSANFLTAPAR